MWHPSDMSFDHVMETACTQTITILYKYFCIWELDLRLNNISFHQFSLFIINYYLLSSLLLFCDKTIGQRCICNCSTWPCLFETFRKQTLSLSAWTLYDWCTLKHSSIWIFFDKTQIPFVVVIQYWEKDSWYVKKYI